LKNKLNRWFEKLKQIAVNRRILVILFAGLLLIDLLLHIIFYKFISIDAQEVLFQFVFNVMFPLFDVFSGLITVTMFLILCSLFKKSRLYSGLQWVLITIILLMMNFIISELRIIFVIELPPLVHFLGAFWDGLIDPGFSNIASYFTYSGELSGAIEYYTDSYRLIPLLTYLLPFLRFVLSFRNPKPKTLEDKTKKPVWSTFWTVIANMAVYVGCFGFVLFIVVMPGAKTIEGYQPYYELVYLFLAFMFVPFIVLGAFGSHHFKRKTTVLFKYNLNFINGMLNIVALIVMLMIAFGCFMVKNLGIAEYDPVIFFQMGWIALVFSLLIAVNIFRILFQNKPLWKMEEEEEAARLARQAIIDQTNNTELRSPVGLVIPFTPDEPKGDNNG